jgi:hypothetical protein
MNVRLTGALVAAMVAAVVLAAAGCGPGAATQSPDAISTIALTPRPPDVPVATPPPVPTPPPVTAVPPAILETVVAEASRLSGVSLAEVAIVRAEAVVWPDSSLGCAQPDEMYTAVLTNGYWVIVEAATVPYDFRVSTDGTFRLCPHPEASDAA